MKKKEEEEEKEEKWMNVRQVLAGADLRDDSAAELGLGSPIFGPCSIGRSNQRHKIRICDK